MTAKSHADRLRRMRNTKVILQELYLAGQELELAMEKGITAGSISGAGHIPGPPGGYPNADTRDLDSKIDTRIAGQTPPTVKVVAYSDHAVFQQFGTSRMAARPFATLAVAETRDDFQARMRRAAAKLSK